MAAGTGDGGRKSDNVKAVAALRESTYDSSRKMMLPARLVFIYYITLSRRTDSRSLGEVLLLVLSLQNIRLRSVLLLLLPLPSPVYLVLPPTLGSLSYARDSHRLLLLYTESPPLISYPVRRALTYNRPRRVPRSFNN